MALFVMITKKRRVAVTDYAGASRAVSAHIERTGIGGSRFTGGPVLDANGKIVARVSYNGRVWEPGDWKPGNVPLYEPTYRRCGPIVQGVMGQISYHEEHDFEGRRVTEQWRGTWAGAFNAAYDARLGMDVANEIADRARAAINL